MNPRTAEKWIEADKYCKAHPVPAILALEAAKRAKVAMRKAVPAKPAIRLPRGVKAKVKRESIPKLKKELDRVFSIFIRTRDASKNMHGMANCVTCGYFARWQDMDAGHYVPRQDLATRWEEKNVHIQCKRCNGFRGGEPEKMAAYIDATYGTFNALNLRNMHKQKFRLTRDWLEMKIRVYKAHIGEATAKLPQSPSPVTPPKGEK